MLIFYLIFILAYLKARGNIQVTDQGIERSLGNPNGYIK